MNHTLTLTLAILLFAATGWGETQTNQVILRLEKLEDSMKGKTNTCLQTAFAGLSAVCKIYGVSENSESISLWMSAHVMVSVSLKTMALKVSYPSVFIRNMDEESKINLVKQLAASGEICRVLWFHYWEWTEKIERWGWIVASEHLARKCRICGKVETKTEVWK